MSGPHKAATDVVGRYAIYDVIASGGMAAVHYGRLRHRLRGFSRVVAIKRAHENLRAHPEFRKVFVDEARIAARVTHSNVVSTLDVVDEDRELLLVMEYVHGESLARLVHEAHRRGERVPPAIAVAIFSAVLHGLHAAHEARGKRGEALHIVHRDVSPQNILVSVDGLAKIADFGIAKAVGRLQATSTGQIKGKMAYMAPEQLRGAPLNRQTDIYAASVCLWEALTTTRFAGTAEDADTVEHTLFGEIAPPSRLAPAVPPSLDAIVLRGLSRERTRRFSTAREMATELDHVMPLATPAEVGAWVEALARDALDARARVLEQIESGSRSTAFSRSPPERPSARRRKLGLAAAVIPLAAIVAIMAVRRPVKQTQASTPVPSVATVDARNVVPVDEPPPADVSPPAPTASAAPVRGTVKRQRSRGFAAGADCSPPYIRDAAGRKTYKINCL